MNVQILLGTRPEMIKLAPVIRALRDAGHRAQVIHSGQHTDLMDGLWEFFEIAPDHTLNLMAPGQSLSSLFSRTIGAYSDFLGAHPCDLILVQGDTTTAAAGASCGFLARIPVAHLEAGLRTNDLNSPFPEEWNRRLITLSSTFHFAPTPQASAQLAQEGVSNHVHCVGNSGIDALMYAQDRNQEREPPETLRSFSTDLDQNPFVLVTLHRRENQGGNLERILKSIRIQLDSNPHQRVVLPVHLNPMVKGPIEQILGGHPQVQLVDPLSYPDLVWCMSRCRFVATDSGGLQEEAPALAKPVLVFRESTERPEGVTAGAAVLAGSDSKRIAELWNALSQPSELFNKMAVPRLIYGDGKTAARVVKILEQSFTSPSPESSGSKA